MGQTKPQQRFVPYDGGMNVRPPEALGGFLDTCAFTYVHLIAIYDSSIVPKALQKVHRPCKCTKPALSASNRGVGRHRS